jgi:ABC-2 type transport system permease protein
MYALRAYVGEATVNGALQKLLQKFRPGELPLATSLDFYQELQAATPDSLQYLLHDLFAANTFWELQTEEASLQADGADQWLVRLSVLARKVEVDTVGTVTGVPMDDYVEIGVFGSAAAGVQDTLYSQKHKIRTGINKLQIRLAKKPVEAAIDPHHLLIETNIQNNRKILPQPGPWQ